MPRRATAAPTIAGVLLAGLVTVLFLHSDGVGVALTVNDVAKVVSGLAAAVALAVRARRSRPRTRPMWALMSVGVLCATSGDVLWSIDTLLLNKPLPFLLIADIGYLIFPILTGIGLLFHPSQPQSTGSALRMVTDAVLIFSSLLTLSWLTSLGAVVRTGTGSSLALVAALAFPVTDVVLLTIVIMTFIRTGIQRQKQLTLTGLALVFQALADSAFIYHSAFAYLPAQSGHATGHPLDYAFVAARLLLALAAITPAPAPLTPARSTAYASGLACIIPYLFCGAGLVAAALALLAYQRRTGLTNSAVLVPVGTATVLVSALVLRQLVTISENNRLLADLAERELLLQHRSLHDDLTGLANRALFADRAAHALTRQPRVGRTIGILVISLDDFKLVNESLGHTAGDALLVQVAHRLDLVARESDTVARLGGDEFGILVEDEANPEETVRRVADAFVRPFEFDGRLVTVLASVGLAVAEPDGPRTGADELLKQADLAVSSAKGHGRGRSVTFSPELARTGAEKFAIRDALVSAITDGAIDVAYQPIVETSSRQLLGFEALARWQLNGRPVRPDIFLPVARRLELIADLDQIVLEKALDQLSRWRAQPDGTSLTMAVNADETLLDGGRAISLYTAALARFGLPPTALVVELPESHLNDSPDLASTVAQLRDCGIRVALDDFGTYGSSLSRLHRIQVDTVKLDRDFLIPGATATVDEVWLGSIIELAHRLGLRVVAEGVETEQQRQMLQDLGCDSVQGYLLGRPVPAAEIRINRAAPAALPG